MNNDSRIFVALGDMEHFWEHSVVASLNGHVRGFKIHESFPNESLRNTIGKLAQCGEVFWDRKIKEIPTEAAKIVHRGLGADYISVHADGGEAMLEACVKAAQSIKSRLIAVLLLSSIDKKAARHIYHEERKNVAKRLLDDCINSGITDIACDGDELPRLNRLREYKRYRGLHLFTVGIMPAWSKVKAPDQMFPITHEAAFAGGADFGIVGRAVMGDPKPIEAAQRLEQEIIPILEGRKFRLGH